MTNTLMSFMMFFHMKFVSLWINAANRFNFKIQTIKNIFDISIDNKNLLNRTNCDIILKLK